MIEITFEDFMNANYEENDYDLYIIKNHMPLYVGISQNNVWNRWFDGRGHMIKNAGGHWMGISGIGMEVVENMPESLAWKVQLWKLEDCVNYCEDEIVKYGYNKARVDIRDIEPLMIQKLSPKMNVIYNTSSTNVTENTVELKRLSETEFIELLKSFGFYDKPTTNTEK